MCTAWAIVIHSQEGALLSTVAISIGVSLLFARSDTARPDGLHARLCHAFII